MSKSSTVVVKSCLDCFKFLIYNLMLLVIILSIVPFFVIAVED